MFVVFDGLDASGKSTQAELLRRHLLSRGNTVVVRTHPSGDSFFGARGRAFLQAEGRGAHAAASLFYLADVVRSIILYRWRRVDYVIFVRYLLGTAYLPEPLHRVAYLLFLRLVPSTPLMFYVKVTPGEAFRRIREGRPTRERFETLEELEKASRKAWSLVSAGGWIILDGDAPPEEVQARVRAAARV